MSHIAQTLGQDLGSLPPTRTIRCHDGGTLRKAFMDAADTLHSFTGPDEAQIVSVKVHKILSPYADDKKETAEITGEAYVPNNDFWVVDITVKEMP